MKVLGRLAATVVTAMALVGRAAEYYYVATNGSDTASGTNWSEAYQTISSAVAQADGPGPYTVYVSNGTYTITNEIVLTNNILVRSWNGAGELDPAGTIVDGNAETRCFRLTHADAVLAGVTVRNGTNETLGGGVYVSGGGMVTQCVVSGNSARDGGGICIDQGLLTHSTIHANMAVSNTPDVVSRGGGVFLNRYGVVSNCQITANTVSNRWYPAANKKYGGGGGICAFMDGEGFVCRVYDSLVSGNVSDTYGGGIQLYQKTAGATQLIVSGSTVRENTTASSGGGMAVVNLNSGGLLTNCLIESNVSESNGGGMHTLAGSMVRDCTLRGNTAAGSGGGAQCINGFNSLVESNSAYSKDANDGGGGVYYTTVAATLSNCVFRGNHAATYGGGIYLWAGKG